MSTHIGHTVIYIVAGVLICLVGALIVRYPEASYAIRTGWKHDDVSLSNRGRADQRMMGVIILLIGLGLLLHGI